MGIGNRLIAIGFLMLATSAIHAAINSKIGSMCFLIGIFFWWLAECICEAARPKQ